MFKSLCLLCQCDSNTDLAICSWCRDSLPFQGNACSACATPLADGVQVMCGRCQRRRAPIASAHSVFRYEGAIPSLLARFKFQHDLVAGDVMSALIAQSLLAQSPPNHALPDAIVPVPLYATRLKARGFNQATLLIQSFATKHKLPIREDLCARIKDTPDQIGLSARERRRNLKKAFRCHNSPMPRHIALFDDVITTGATVLNLALMFKHAGVERVDAWSLARTP